MDPHTPMRKRAMMLTAIWLSATCATQAFADRWEDSEREIVKRPPRAFALLPTAFRDSLSRDGCEIPQPWGAPVTANAIRGHFASRRQTDYAVLCSADGRSTIRVFWGGPRRCASTFDAGLDRGYLQVVDAGTIGYSHQILTASYRMIVRHRKWYGGPEIPADRHDGIDDAYLGKASVTMYCSHGEWVPLQGAD